MFNRKTFPVWGVTIHPLRADVEIIIISFFKTVNSRSRVREMG
jgi:hypothetical protein